MTNPWPAPRARPAGETPGLEIRNLLEVGELGDADRLLAAIWGTGGGFMGVNVLRALAHSGNYVAGAWQDGELVAASVGWAWGPDRPATLHSHVTGVAPRLQGRGVGRALKLHQAEWSRSRAMRTVTWTFDPLVRGNGWFNLVTLAARAESYHPDFYGPMSDGFNDGEPTDRCLVVWRLAGLTPAVEPERLRAGPPPAGAGVRLLTESGRWRPEVSPTAGADPSSWPDRVLCQVPADVIALRRHDPELAAEWRVALRATMGRAMTAAYAATSMTSAGFYVLERTAQQGQEVPG